MNIFVLNKDPWKCVKHYCDIHVNKMLLESCQMLCNAFSDAPYRKTHLKHPCSIWTLETTSNWQWLLSLANALSVEYTKRTGKTHGCDKVVDWLNNQDETSTLVAGDLTPWPQVMPEDFKEETRVLKCGKNDSNCSYCVANAQLKAIIAYRCYYAAKLRDFRKRGLI